MQLRQQIVLYAVFAVGGLIVISGIIRTALMYKLQQGSYDYTYTALWETWIWSIVEIWLSIVCASAPALKPFFGKMLGSRLGSRGRSGTLAYGTGGINTMRTMKRSAQITKGAKDDMPSDSKSILVQTEVSVVGADKVSGEEFSLDIENFYAHDQSAPMGVERDEVPLRHIARCEKGL